MKVLLLSPSPEKLLPCINSIDDEFVLLNAEVNKQFIVDGGINLLISYNYRYIIENEVLQIPGLRALNLHTSLLPFNRGSHPILWGILEGTPLGVTIHQIEKDLDTGPIVFQKEIQLFDQNKSLREVHEEINTALIDIFCTNWINLRDGNYITTPQAGPGTYHRSAIGHDFVSSLDKSWDTSVKDLAILYSYYLNQKRK
jgi:methionyl-tRNA formyltransferase